MRPKARRLAQHGGPPGWLKKSYDTQGRHGLVAGTLVDPCLLSSYYPLSKRMPPLHEIKNRAKGSYPLYRKSLKYQYMALCVSQRMKIWGRAEGGLGNVYVMDVIIVH
jgi:hypothetical protein